MKTCFDKYFISWIQKYLKVIGKRKNENKQMDIGDLRLENSTPSELQMAIEQVERDRREKLFNVTLIVTAGRPKN